MHETVDHFILSVEAAAGRLGGLGAKKWRIALDAEVAKFPSNKQEFVRSYLALKSKPNPSRNQMKNKINWPVFGVGCVILLVAIVAFFWAFSLEHLSPSRRFLLLWILPLASGFGCMTFAGSIKASGPVGSLAVGATGGFAVWLITILFLPTIPDQPLDPTFQELSDTLESRHDTGVEIISDLKAKIGTSASQLEMLNALERKYTSYYKEALDAVKKRQLTRFYETSRRMAGYLASPEVSSILPPEIAERLLNAGSAPLPVTPTPTRGTPKISFRVIRPWAGEGNLTVNGLSEATVDGRRTVNPEWIVLEHAKINPGRNTLKLEVRAYSIYPGGRVQIRIDNDERELDFSMRNEQDRREYFITREIIFSFAPGSGARIDSDTTRDEAFSREAR